MLLDGLTFVGDNDRIAAHDRTHDLQQFPETQRLRTREVEDPGGVRLDRLADADPQVFDPCD